MRIPPLNPVHLAIVFLVVFLVPDSCANILFAQVPPPHLPGAPDQSPVSGSFMLALAAIGYGAYRLHFSRK